MPKTAFRVEGERFARRLGDLKTELAPADFGWYPYKIAANLEWVEKLVADDSRPIEEIIGRRVADIGAADGDLAFYLESLGKKVDLIDFPPTNYNQLQGARTLREELDSSVEIHEVDLDSQFALPRERYDTIFFFGILYHLKNPFYALETLAKSCRHLFLSTRVARFTPPLPGNSDSQGTPIRDLPVAYLVDTVECNHDPTNFWVFSESGLRRLLRRAGWSVWSQAFAGDLEASDPARLDHDERAFMWLRSLRFHPPEYVSGWRDADANGLRWTSESAQAVVHTGSEGEVRLRGHMSERILEKAYGGSLTLRVALDDGEPVVHELTRFGVFELALEARPHARTSVSISLDKSFVPSEIGISKSNSRLGIVVSQLAGF